MYYMPDPVGCIQKARSLLKRNGKLLILHQTEFGCAEIINRFKVSATVAAKSNDETNLDPYCNHELSAHEISAILNEHKIPHLYHLSEWCGMEVDDFFHDRPVKLANAVISFWLQSKFENLESDLKEDIRELVKERCRLNDYDKQVLYHPVAMIKIEAS